MKKVKMMLLHRKNEAGMFFESIDIEVKPIIENSGVTVAYGYPDASGVPQFIAVVYNGVATRLKSIPTYNTPSKSSVLDSIGNIDDFAALVVKRYSELKIA